MSLMCSPVTLVSSRITSVVFQMTTRRKCLKFEKGNLISALMAAKKKDVLAYAHFLALRGVMSKGGPGAPMLLGKMSTHI